MGIVSTWQPSHNKTCSGGPSYHRNFVRQRIYTSPAIEYILHLPKEIYFTRHRIYTAFAIGDICFPKQLKTVLSCIARPIGFAIRLVWASGFAIRHTISCDKHNNNIYYWKKGGHRLQILIHKSCGLQIRMNRRSPQSEKTKLAWKKLSEY